MTAFRRLAQFCGLVGVLAASSASASPWAEVGDAQLRSDIEILAAAGSIDDVTTQWPLPWASIVSRLGDPASLSHRPQFVQEAARRVLQAAQLQMRFGELNASATVDGTNSPSVVRGFDSLGREVAQGQVSAEYVGGATAIRISIGGEIHDHSGRTAIVPDGSYIAEKLGGAIVYAGYLTHWWGPGWVSALSLSNNARPFPQIGIERGETTAFNSPWLSWLGPWQAEFFVGLLDDSRVATNTIYNGLRVTFNPLPGLEIGLARTEELCGKGHSCVPFKYYFEFANDPSHINHTNDEGLIDVRYSSVVFGAPFEGYMQLMNEDSSPITHSVTSHLFGASLWIPINRNALRLTTEYTDTVPTINFFSFGNVLHGAAYNNFQYADGMRYRGRTLGFSLDSDSTLLSVQASFQDSDNWSYEFSLHHAAISNPQNLAGNVVTTAPVHITMVEARLGFPLRNMHFDLATRVQDDQPRPAHGFQASVEAMISYRL